MAEYILLLNDTKLVGSHKLFRIKSPTGKLGGYIGGSLNLSQEGKCWLHGDSVAYENAKVSDDAQVYGRVYGDAIIMDRSEVYGQAYGKSVVKDRAKVYGSISGEAVADGDAVIYGDLS